MHFSDNFFKKVENKTNINKDTILGLASKLQKSNLKDEGVLREVIRDLSSMTGKTVTSEQESKIIDTIVKDKVPKDMNKYYE